MQYEEMKNTIDLVNKLLKEGERAEALELDKSEGEDAFYVDYSEEDSCWYVFGSESGFAYYASYDEDEAKAALAELQNSISEDYLEPKEETLIGDDEEDVSVSEDYNQSGQYGDTQEEVLKNIAQKYLGVSPDDFGRVEVDVESLWTALSDAFTGGQDLAYGSDCDSCDDEGAGKKIEIEVELDVEADLKEAIKAKKLNESQRINGKVKDGSGNSWDYAVDAETGEMTISTTFKEVNASTTIVSEEIHSKVQDIIFSDDSTMEDKLAMIESLKHEVAGAIREFFNQSTIQDHVSEVVSDTLDAYSGSLTLKVDETIRENL